jgi:hypothetical protein
MTATDPQVQAWVTTRMRPRAEQIRALYNAMSDDIAAINDVYANLTQQSPTWTDSNPSNPPNLLTVANVLAMNEFWNTIANAIKNEPNYAIVQQACVNPLN